MTTAIPPQWGCSKPLGWNKGRRRTPKLATERKRKTRKASGAGSHAISAIGRRKIDGAVLGVWVVYFALGSLPIFGLGQALIDADDVGRRRTVFWLMSLYAGSALGLLMTTCFLSLRRYLRQRGVTMPAAMTSVWLTTGGVMVLVLLLLAALLPRPKAEYRLVDLTPLGQDEKKASKYSMKKGDSGKGRGSTRRPTRRQRKGPGH